MRILNLFAGIGGNRTLWGDEHEITAVENDESIANYYKEQFPRDEVMIGDAHEYLELNFSEFDIIWASPPCTSHTILSKMRVGRVYNKTYTNDRIKIPDLRLYGIILFLRDLFRGDWVVENVKPFYKPFIEPTTIIGRHYIWSNVNILPIISREAEHLNSWQEEARIKGLDVEKLRETKFTTRKDVIVHNCVNAMEGKYILDTIMNKKQLSLEAWAGR